MAQPVYPMRMVAIAMNLFIVMSLLGSCSPSTRQKIITTTFVSLNAARDGFVAFDKATQDQIVADAKTLADGQAALATYRTKRAKIIDLFSGAYQALAAATLIESDPKSLANMLLAAQALSEALKSFQGSL